MKGIMKSHMSSDKHFQSDISSDGLRILALGLLMSQVGASDNDRPSNGLWRVQRKHNVLGAKRNVHNMHSCKVWARCTISLTQFLVLWITFWYTYMQLRKILLLQVHEYMILCSFTTLQHGNLYLYLFEQIKFLYVSECHESFVCLEK